MGRSLTMQAMRVDSFVDHLSQEVKRSFSLQRRVLSFDDYLRLVEEQPWQHTRDAARYLRDCFLHFGTREVSTVSGPLRRFCLFDPPRDKSAHSADDNTSSHPGHVGGDASEASPDAYETWTHLVGHERAQNEVFALLETFVREGRANKLVLLHGPNGSAKSTFVASIFHGLERYSQSKEGGLYRFSWVFERGASHGGIGFHDDEAVSSALESLAHLSHERIDLQIASELREHPLLLLPLAHRRTWLAALYANRHISVAPPDWLWSGDLGHKNRQIFDALLTAYRGDVKQVLRHVQVERYAISRRYRTGLVTIGPEMAVDAKERQITADRSLQALPASLSALTLYEAFGDLVDGSAGVIEYSDLLKRPLDAWKYLLLAIETGEVSLSFSNLPLNTVMFASSNDMHLQAFREHHEYASFRGRMAFVRMGYLLSYLEEEEVYASHLSTRDRVHVAPYALRLAALWAVLTRLHACEAERYSTPRLGKLAASLTPIEKAELYATCRVPTRFGSDEAAELRKGMQEVIGEWDHTENKEGGQGASAREMRRVISLAAQDSARGYLSPGTLLQCLHRFCEEGDFSYLKGSKDKGKAGAGHQGGAAGFGDAAHFLRLVRERWLDWVEQDLQASAGFVDEGQYVMLFARYVACVSTWLKKEDLYNPVTKRFEAPDEELMNRVEDMLGVDDKRESFRGNLMSKIAGHAMRGDQQSYGDQLGGVSVGGTETSAQDGGHWADWADEGTGAQQEAAKQAVDYKALFPSLIRKLEESYHAARRKQLGTLAKGMLAMLKREEAGPGSGKRMHDAGRHEGALVTSEARSHDEKVDANATSTARSSGHSSKGAVGELGRELQPKAAAAASLESESEQALVPDPKGKVDSTAGDSWGFWSIADVDRTQVHHAAEAMMHLRGYQHASLREALGELVNERYAE